MMILNCHNYKTEVCDQMYFYDEDLPYVTRQLKLVRLILFATVTDSR